MGTYRSKPLEIEAFTFEELVAHGRANATSLVNGVPWSFTFQGCAITHERDDCYLIPTRDGIKDMTPQTILVTDWKGELDVLNKRDFEQTYEAVPQELTEGFIYSTGQDDVNAHIVASLLEEAEKARAAYTYTTKPGESVMGIALRECGHEQKWRHILACNPQFSTWLPHEYFPVGTVLILPPKEEAA